jgi:hypothetical protein
VTAGWVVLALAFVSLHPIDAMKKQDFKNKIIIRITVKRSLSEIAGCTTWRVWIPHGDAYRVIES